MDRMTIQCSLRIMSGTIAAQHKESVYAADRIRTRAPEGSYEHP